MPAYAFLFRSRRYDVPTVFQVWERRSYPRELHATETSHPDFKFTCPAHADFAVQRVGARAGRLHHDLTASRSSHYSIKGDVERIMRRLDLAGVARNAAGNPSLANAEIVRLYREWVEAHGKERA